MPRHPRHIHDPEGQIDAAARVRAEGQAAQAATEQAYSNDLATMKAKNAAAWRSEAPRNASQPKRDAARPAKTRTG